MGEELKVEAPIGNNESVDDVLGKLSGLDDDKDESGKGEKKGLNLSDDDADTDSNSDDDEDEDELDDDSDADDEDEDGDGDKKSKGLKLEDNEDEILSDLPKRKEILAKFPDLFKTFPKLENAFFREQQYAEIFPTPKEAKSAMESVENLKKIESEFLSGDIETTLNRLKTADPKALGKITDNILETIKKVDREAYLNTLTKVTKNMLFAVAKYGKDNDTGEDSDARQLQIAARLIHKHYFNDPNVTPAEESTKPTTEVDPKAEAVTKREEALNQRELTNATQDVVSRVNNKIQTAVTDAIDPKGAMTPYLKKTAVKDVMVALDSELTDDPRFRAQIDRLWKDAQKASFSDESKSKIRKAFLSKANTILPDIMRRVRGEALKGVDSRKKDESDKPKFRRQATPSNNRSDKKPETKKKVSTSSVSDVVDFLGS